MIYDLQKASLGKRISAALFDFILLATVVVALAYLLSLVLGYDKYNQTLLGAYERYAKEYDISFDLTQEEFNNLTEEELANYEAATMALQKDKDAIYAQNMLFNLSMTILSISILGGYLILEFFVPNLFKNGQTLGKRIFGIGVMREDGVQVVPQLMFIRTVLGKFTVETMIPVLIVIMFLFGAIGILGTIIIGLILLMQIILMIVTHTNSMIHDVLAKTVVVDIASQLIFESEDAMIEYKTRMHAQEAAKQTY